MILIWDNGRSYSDHAIHFVDLGSAALAPLEAVLVKAPRGRILVTCGKVEWHDPRASQTMAEFVQDLVDWEGEHTGWCESREACTCWLAELQRLVDR